MIIPVMIEIPKNSRNKYEFDIHTKEIKFDRMLTTSTVYPCDYGFVKRTWAEDNDPLDALVIVRESTFPGCIIQVRPLGVLLMKDEHGIDYKILSVPDRDPHYKNKLELTDISSQMLKEIEHFYSVYKDLDEGGNNVVIDGWGDRLQAEKIIEESKARYDRECNW